MNRKMLLVFAIMLITVSMMTVGCKQETEPEFVPTITAPDDLRKATFFDLDVTDEVVNLSMSTKQGAEVMVQEGYTLQLRGQTDWLDVTPDKGKQVGMIRIRPDESFTQEIDISGLQPGVYTMIKTLETSDGEWITDYHFEFTVR